MKRWVQTGDGMWARVIHDTSIHLQERHGVWVATWDRNALKRGPQVWCGSGDTPREALEALTQIMSGSSRRSMRRLAATLPPEIGAS